MKYKIINKGSPIDYENEIHSLTNFAKERFGFKKPPSFVMQDDPDNASKLLGKTGFYDPNSMQIHIFTTGRHPKDILRSIAHELVHHMQHDKGDLDRGGYSGQGYAQKNPHLRNMEKQAYEMGNLCFRDWEDGLKQEQPTIYNERRNRKMSLKEWKNKELRENLTEKWGFKMDLSKLNEKDHKLNEEVGGLNSKQDVIRVTTPVDSPVKIPVGSFIFVVDKQAKISPIRVIGRREGEIQFCRAGVDLEEWKNLGAGGEQYKMSTSILFTIGDSIARQRDQERYAADITKNCPKLAQQSPFQEEKENKAKKKKSKKTRGKFPDLTGDGKVTRADILVGRGVELKDKANEVSHSGASQGHAGKRRRK